MMCFQASDHGFFLRMRHFRVALAITHDALIAAAVEGGIMGIGVLFL